MVKKLLFTAAIAAVASTAFPQGKAVRVGAQPNKADQKSVHLKPAGLPFEATPKNGQMFGTSYLYTPGNYEVKFVPVAAPGTQTFWHQNVYDMMGNCNSFDRTGKQGRFYSTDNDGNLYVICRFNGADASPRSFAPRIASFSLRRTTTGVRWIRISPLLCIGTRA